MVVGLIIRKLGVRKKPSIRNLTMLMCVPEIPGSATPAGPRLVMRDYFITPQGKDETAFTDKADVEKTAAAAMELFRIDTSESGLRDYEIVSLKPDHKARQYYVVWFPQESKARSHSVLYDSRFKRLTDKMTILHQAFRLAEVEHKNKLAASTE